MNSTETLRRIRGFDALVESGGPSHHCLKCGWMGVQQKDGCSVCGMYGNVQSIAEPEAEETGEIIEEYTINLPKINLKGSKSDDNQN